MDRNIISQTQIDTTIKSPVSFLEVNIDNCKIPHSVPEFDRVWKKSFENLKIEKENLLEELNNTKKKRILDENEKRNKIQNLQRRINEIEVLSIRPDLWAKICWSVIRDGKVKMKLKPLKISPELSSKLFTPSVELPSDEREEDIIVRIPNGCCNNPDCSINLYYSLLIEELSKE